MTATIVITTKNRKEELCRALESCLRQTRTVEVLVLDDGSTDGTAAHVKTRFPSVRLVRFEKSRGYITARNEAARVAVGDVIISIDDDAEFSQPTIVEAVLREMDDPRIAAVAIPFIDVNLGKKLKQRAPDRNVTWITNEFIGTAHAIRKDVFGKIGGYREVLFHQGEEGDLCIRLLQHGWVIRLGTSAPILHHRSAIRSHERINVFGQRNLILFAWHNVPTPEFFPHLVMTIFNGLRWGLHHGTLGFRLRGTGCGVLAIAQEFSRRAPMSRGTYWLYRRLKERGPIRFRDAEEALTYRP
jgi:GT2 family glycosyltransferase